VLLNGIEEIRDENELRSDLGLRPPTGLERLQTTPIEKQGEANVKEGCPGPFE